MSNIHTPLFLESPENKGIVVFIHGFLGSPRQFDRFAQAVHQQGFSTAALLLPGHGCSAKDFGSGTFERWQSFVDAEVERFSQKYAKIWLVGHSMGGLLAINAAVKHSETVCGIFPIASPLKITIFSMHALKVRAILLFYRKSHPVKASYLSGCSVRLTPNMLWHIIKPFFELVRVMRVTRDNLPNVRAPMIAAYSTSDELVSIKSLAMLKSGLDGVDFEELLLSKSLHAYYTEDEAARIEQALVRFVSY